MTAEVSRAISSFVKTVLSFLLSGDGEQGQEGDHLLRKLAHFTEFACLGILSGWLIQMLRDIKWQWIALPLAFGVLVACVDETIQIFVPGRGPGILDVGIDSLGVLLGVVLINIYASIKTKFWRKI